MSIIISHVSYSYSEDKDARPALKDISITVDPGEVVSIIGHTGSGKTTLACLMNGLLIAGSGEITVDGNLAKDDPDTLRSIRKDVGHVFQYPEQQFFAETVRDELEFAPRNWGLDSDEVKDVVDKITRDYAISEEILSKNPFELSGGQMRRVAIASVLTALPKYIVLDEPSAGLDSDGLKDLEDMQKDMSSRGVGVVLITHDISTAFKVSDKIMILEDGRSLFVGDVRGAADHLSSHDVRGISLPPLARICQRLRGSGIEIDLLGGIGEIVEAVRRAKSKRD